MVSLKLLNSFKNFVSRDLNSQQVVDIYEYPVEQYTPESSNISPL